MVFLLLHLLYRSHNCPLILIDPQIAPILAPSTPFSRVQALNPQNEAIQGRQNHLQACP